MNLPEEKNNQYQEGPSELDDMLDVGEEITVEEMPGEHEQGIVQEHILQQDVYGEDGMIILFVFSLMFLFRYSRIHRRFCCS